MRLNTGAKTFLLLFITGLVISVSSIKKYSHIEKNAVIPSLRSFIPTDTESDFTVFFKNLDSDSSKKTESSQQPAVYGSAHSAQVQFSSNRLRGLAAVSASVAIHRLRLILFPFHVFD